MIHSGLVKFHDDLGPMLVDIDSVAQHPDNYNNGDVEKVAESIEVNGMYRPIFAQRGTGYIIAGNHTWEACKMLNAHQIPVVFLDVDNAEAVKIMLADNRIAQMARPDSARLVDLLKNLMDSEKGALELLGTGYTEFDLEVHEHLAEIPFQNDEFGTWPTFTVQLPPNVMRGFREMTDHADSERDKFEVLMRLAGWKG